MRKIVIAALLSASAATAQVEQGILEDLMRDFGGNNGVPERGAITSQLAVGAMLRGLDKMTGRAVDIPVMVGQEASYERLILTLEACRLPEAGDAPDAYAFVSIRDRREDTPRFSGWMIASSPALNAMDHPRYDIWVTDCIEDATAPEGMEDAPLPNDG